MNEPLSQSQFETAERDEVARLNRQALSALMRDYSLIIRAADFANWRPTKRESGDIVGVMEGLTIIATDGLLAYFLDSEDRPFCGHIQCFSGEVKPLFSTQKDKDKTIKTSKVRKKRMTLMERALEVLTEAL